jgi:hypothetical protein
VKSVLLAIQSYPGANETVARHWPYYLQAQADEIIGIGTINGACRFPNEVRTYQIGIDSYVNGDHLPRRLVNTIEVCLQHAKHHIIAIAEYDTVFFRPIPRDLDGVYAHLAGGQLPGRKATRFFHGPWIFDRDSAEVIMRFGNEMLADGDIECGSPDVFFGRMADRFGFSVKSAFLEYSRNSLDIPHQLEEARQAYRAGAVCIHGVKTEDQLQALFK